MRSLIKNLHAFGRDESGATAIEYGLIASLIAVAIMAGAFALNPDHPSSPPPAQTTK